MTLSDLVATNSSPVDWLAQPWIAPGRPTLLFGAKDTAKSLVAYDLLLATAYGRSWLASVPLQRQGRAVYLDYEPKVPPPVRVQQLMDFNPRTAINPMGERDLEVKCPPKYKLSDSRAQTWLEELCRDTTLLVVASLAAATPGLDERAIEYRQTLDMLTEVSATTGVCVVIIHHEGLSIKGQSGGRPRGHTGIVQACGSEIRLTKNGNMITMTCRSPGAAGMAPDPVTVELTAPKPNPATGLADTIRLRPPKPKLCGVVVPLRLPAKAADAAKAKTGTRQTKQPNGPSDGELAELARAEFKGQPSATVLRKRFNIGAGRARRIRDMLK